MFACWVSSVAAQVVLPPAQVNFAYSYQVVTTPPAPAGSVYAITGLPIGMSINAATGLISGGPISSATGNWGGTISISGPGSVTSFNYTIFVESWGVPIAMSQPVSTTVAEGRTAVLSAYVYGDPSPTLQWRKDGNAVSGATTDTLTIANMQLVHTGIYDLVMTNTLGTRASFPVTLALGRVYGNPLGPVGATVAAIDPQQVLAARFTLATGARIVAATADFAHGAGTFFAALVPLSSASALPVGGAAAGEIFNAGEVAAVATFTLPAGFSGPVSVPFSFDAPAGVYGVVFGTEAFGATGTGGLVRYASTAGSGGFVRNRSAGGPFVWSESSDAQWAIGLVTSSGPFGSPSIVVPPVARAVAVGGKAVLTVAAAGSAPLTYQWSKDGVAFVGATAATLPRVDFQPSAAGTYTVKVTNALGSVTASADLSVSPTPSPAVALTSPVGGANFAPGGTHVLTAMATPESGRFIARVEFYAGSVLLGTVTSAPYAWSWTPPSGSGTYVLTARATDSAALTTISTPVTVTVSVAGPPTVTLTAPAAAASLPLAADVTLTATAAAATGRTLTSVAFFANGQSLSSPDTSAPFAVQWTPTLTGEIALTAVATDDVGVTTTSAPVNVTVFIPPSLPFVSTACGDGHALYLRSDGLLFATGRNDHGQLGDGTRATRTAPVNIATDVVAVAAGDESSYFLKSDATLWAMGRNSAGQLGDGTTVARDTPVPTLFTQVAAFSPGRAHLLVLKSDGTLWAVGQNSDGQLGDDSLVDRLTPVPVATGVASIGAGAFGTHFVRSDRTLWSTGRNTFGQLGDGTTVSRRAPVRITSDVTVVSAGESHTMLVKTDGSLWGMGRGYSGALASGSLADKRVPTIALAAGIASVVARADYTLILREDGGLFGLGSNIYGQLGVGETSEQQPALYQIGGYVRSVSAGVRDRRTLNTDGTLWAAGDNSFGQFGDGTTTARIGGYAPFPTPLPPAVPAAPLGLTATAGTLPGLVRLAWRPVIGATHYEIWRANFNSSATATLLVARASTLLHYDAPPAAATTCFYWVKAVAFDQASAFSDSAPGSTSAAPAIVSSPAARAVDPGSTVTFSVVAAGLAPLTYQWRLNDAPLAGATGPVLTLTGVTLGAAGRYDVVVTNAYGSAVSDPAALAVNGPPAFVTLGNPVFFVGRPGIFAPVVTGSPAPTFTVVAGTFPSWLAFDTVTGVLSGTPPDATGSPFAFVLTANNGLPPRAERLFTLNVLRAHSADTSPADGALNLVELTRVLELYNTSHRHRAHRALRRCRWHRRRLRARSVRNRRPDTDHPAHRRSQPRRSPLAHRTHPSHRTLQRPRRHRAHRRVSRRDCAYCHRRRLRSGAVILEPPLFLCAPPGAPHLRFRLSCFVSPCLPTPG
jgi:alpha-tubulin suppressor-like RCC1 family protein